jgi:hypothetical protein
MSKTPGAFGLKNNSERDESIKFRVSKKNKELFLRAASMQGESLSDFIHLAIRNYIISGSYKLITITAEERNSIINDVSKYSGSLYKKELRRKRILSRPL